MWQRTHPELPFGRRQSGHTQIRVGHPITLFGEGDGALSALD